ncbi:CiaD-like domain-containing protein [Helicobacter marmotae]|uniref:Campylobacter invasion antigen D C-terminal domain-containing protein n=1 Tax=Helicobacter marmotae TaxID=152490 RepID=A0A3D8I5I5_9HELI|nr:hypothetical protein [Helicobacter marmotae]RDU60430.1 hypothetical protein CQA63_02420 [Helicobacter marmotae]
MELKDLILQTLNEISEVNEDSPKPYQSNGAQNTFDSIHANTILRNECEFLEMLQERLLVLFEGLNAPHNKNLETKLNITINFLEYQLSIINERLNDIKR